MNNKNKTLKFLSVLKKFWYVVLISTIIFSGLGYFVGEKKSSKDIPFSREAKYFILKTNIIISSGNYQDFSETFNNACLYFMKSGSVIKDSVNEVNKDMTEAESLKIINVESIEKVSNMVSVVVKYTNKDDAKLVLDTYIEKSISYLNRTLKNNLKEDGTFKEGVELEEKILLTQIGSIEYNEQQETIAKKVTNVMKFVVMGTIIGVIVGLLLIYFFKFYFIIHELTDVTKNFEIDYIGSFESEKAVEEYIENNKDLVFCSGGKIRLAKQENYFTKEEIINKSVLDLGENNNLIILIKEDVDTFFYVEKVQMLLKKKIRGFILYK